jgi:hypothetical protein
MVVDAAAANAPVVLTSRPAPFDGAAPAPNPQTRMSVAPDGRA